MNFRFRLLTLRVTPASLALYLWFLACGWPRLGFTQSAASTNSDLSDIPPLRPPWGEIPPSFWERHGFAVSVGLLLAIPLLFFALWLATRRRASPQLPPPVQAKTALAELRVGATPEQVLTQAPQIVKRCFAELHSLPAAVELTTAEFCQAMESSSGTTPVLRSETRSFLLKCDELKFGLNPPAEATDVLNKAETLIELSQRQAELSSPLPPKGATSTP